VLYEAVRDNLATLLAEASEVVSGLPLYVEWDFARYLLNPCSLRSMGSALTGRLTAHCAYQREGWGRSNQYTSGSRQARRTLFSVSKCSVWSR
jgi:hypothetical protein